MNIGCIRGAGVGDVLYWKSRYYDDLAEYIVIGKDNRTGLPKISLAGYPSGYSLEISDCDCIRKIIKSSK